MQPLTSGTEESTRPKAIPHFLEARFGPVSVLPTIHSVAESGGLSDERCFPPIRQSTIQFSLPVNSSHINDVLFQQTFLLSLSHRPQPANGPANDLRSSPEG